MTDLEKAIELARKHEELFGIRKREECCVAACQEMAEWKERQIIEKACEWLDENWTSFVNYDDEDGVVYYWNLTDKFKEFMEINKCE